ncbi:MAG TPA: hypothetical protein VFY16_03950 [Gemmatimonadaceae bacterium]|nr:hypothetical protein [Gemmatimonadaceae bacterium]
MRGGGLLAVAAVAAVCGPPVALAQRPISVSRTPRPELRVDVLGARRDMAVHAGAGVAMPVGTNVRLAALGGAGVAEGGRTSGRVELVSRVLLDPFGRQRWGFYAAAGLGVRWDEGRRGRSGVVALVGADAPRLGPVRPALEVGVGGGWRVAAVVRGAK